MKIGTWNVRSLYEAGKLANVIQEMKRHKIDILGLCETWWPNNGICNSDGVKTYYSGNDSSRHRNGVGIMVSKNLADTITDFIPLSDRAMLIKFNSKPINLNIIQVYAPTSEKSDTEIEKFYDEVKKLMNLVKPHEMTLIMGDFNAKVGNEKVEGIVGSFGLGKRNERGERLVQFCQEENFKITNTWFSLPKRRIYTWKSPKDNDSNIVRNQIDYILINKRFQSSVAKVSTYPGADVPSDHNLLNANIKIRLSHTKKRKQDHKPSFQLLQDQDTNAAVREVINNNIINLNYQDNNTEHMDVETIWNHTKNIFKETTNKLLKQKKIKGKQKWMTDKILALMEERRKFKSKNETEYKRLHNVIRKEIKHAKHNWFNIQCSEIENLQLLHNDYALHKKIKETSGVYRKKTFGVLMNDGNQIISGKEEVKITWEKYVQGLFNDESRQDFYLNIGNDILSGQSITKEEVLKAINTAKNKKSVGPDEIPAELYKLIDEENIGIMVKIFNKIYDYGVYPQEWLQSTFVPLPKKSRANKCDDYRLISLMSHGLKIFLKILHKRLFAKCEQSMGRTQFGFKQAMGTREALFSLQVLVQNCKDVQKDIFICFIDYEKAFDKVLHTKLFDILRQMDIDEKEIRCISNLYWGQTANVRLENDVTSDVAIKRGVRQGCILSPMLFNLYSEHIFEAALASVNLGIKVNGEIINNIRFADDTTILADNINDLQDLVKEVSEKSLQYGLSINTQKTKFMVVSKNSKQITNSNIYVYGNPIQRVSRFKYLGCWLSDTWTNDREICCRIEAARETFFNYRKVLSNKSLNMKLRLRYLKCYVWSVLLYGAEAWTLKVTSMNKLEAFEMWCYRRIMKIPWTDKVSNKEVLTRLRKDREMLLTIKRRKTAYFGHIMRGPKYELLQLIVQGKIEGKRGIGRKQMSWLRNIREWTGLRTIGQLVEAARSRNNYHNIISNIL